MCGFDFDPSQGLLHLAADSVLARPQENELYSRETRSCSTVATFYGQLIQLLLGYFCQIMCDYARILREKVNARKERKLYLRTGLTHLPYSSNAEVSANLQHFIELVKN